MMWGVLVCPAPSACSKHYRPWPTTIPEAGKLIVTLSYFGSLLFVVTNPADGTRHCVKRELPCNCVASGLPQALTMATFPDSTDDSHLINRSQRIELGTRREIPTVSQDLWRCLVARKWHSTSSHLLDTSTWLDGFLGPTMLQG